MFVELGTKGMLRLGRWCRSLIIEKRVKRNITSQPSRVGRFRVAAWICRGLLLLPLLPLFPPGDRLALKWWAGRGESVTSTAGIGSTSALPVSGMGSCMLVKCWLMRPFPLPLPVKPCRELVERCFSMTAALLLLSCTMLVKANGKLRTNLLGVPGREPMGVLGRDAGGVVYGSAIVRPNGSLWARQTNTLAAFRRSEECGFTYADDFWLALG